MTPVERIILLFGDIAVFCIRIHTVKQRDDDCDGVYALGHADAVKHLAPEQHGRLLVIALVGLFCSFILVGLLGIKFAVSGISAYTDRCGIHCGAFRFC